MMTRLARTVARGLVLSVLAPAIAAAQDPAAQPTAKTPSAQAGRGAVPTNSELATILDAYAIVQAQKALQLDDGQYGPFVTRLKRLQDTRRRGTQARNRLMQELRRLANDPAADEGLIRERLASLRAAEEESALAVRQAYDGVDEVLDARQRVRFRQFETQLESRKLDLLMRARARAKLDARPGSGPR
jgi:hypothetical protein